MSRLRLPTSGQGRQFTRAVMTQAHTGDQPWHHERAFLGGSYFGGEQVVKVANQAYQSYINANALFACKMFPSEGGGGRTGREAAGEWGKGRLLDLTGAPPACFRRCLTRDTL